MQKTTEIVKGKKVLFITTKNLDYIRNTQEIRIIKENAKSLDIVCSNKKNNPLRILHVWTKIKKERIEKSDIIFVGFEPQFVVPFFTKKFKDRFLIIDCFISVYDTLICDRQKFKKGGLIAKICHWIDEKTIKQADHIICDTKAHAKYFIDEFNADKKKIETIYLEADSSIYYSRSQQKPDFLMDRFVVLYFGSILPLQGVDVVLDAIRELKDCKNIFFEIIGPINNKFDKPIQENVQYIDWLSQEKLAEHIAYADLCLAGHFDGKIEKAKRTIPGKAYIYEAMNKRIVLGDGPANHELFEADEKHFFVKMGKAGEIKDIILEVMNNYGKE